MSQELHVQCVLVKHNEVKVVWIPKEFANPGQYVKLRETTVDGKEWDDGWLVKCAVSAHLPTKYIVERGQDYKKTRKASDA